MKSVLFTVCIMMLLPGMVRSADGKNDNNAKVTIIIEPVFNGAPLKLNDKYYVNEHGDTLYVELFRFYMTNLKLSAPGVSASDPNSHLVDAEEKETNTFYISNVPAGKYTSLHFVVGVDSIANTSGANGGDLDPSKGMYWAWNSGYIMAKLEGHSKVCKTLHHAFEFHVGGYMPPYNAARDVQVQFPTPVEVSNGSNTVIRIKADAAAWFKGNVNLAAFNDVVIPGKEANIVADKYARMFSAE